MKLKCVDGKTRRFEISKYQEINTAYGSVKTTKLLEAYCVDCGEEFGCHDTKVLKPIFRKHKCKNKICPRCEGTGKYARLGFTEKDCSLCEGKGKIL